MDNIQQICKICAKRLKNSNQTAHCDLCFPQKSIHKPIKIFLEDEFDRFSEVDEIIFDKLYLGNETTSKKLPILQQLNINRIIVAGDCMEKSFESHFKYIVLADLQDTLTHNIIKYFKQCIDFIDKVPKDKVYVHCVYGRSRSTTIVIAYLMNKTKCNRFQCLEYVKSKRPIAEPNENFMKQLEHFQKQLYIKN